MDERFFVEKKLWRGKEGTHRPCRHDQDLSALPRPGKVHRMRDGVVAVDAERHQHVSRRVGRQALHELDELAGQIARFPRHGDAPNDIGQHVQQPDAQICG